MRALLLLALGALLGGCSNILGIHQLDDAGGGSGSGTDDATIDGIVPSDAMTDGSTTDGNMNPVYIGERTALAATTTITGNYMVARRFTVGGTTVISGAGAYLINETANGKIKFAIYNDNANSPYTRRVIGVDVTLDGTAGYNDTPLGPHTLQAGTYWMVIATDSSIDIGSQDSNNVVGAAASLPYSAALPTMYSPQPTSSTTSDRINLYLQAQP